MFEIPKRRAKVKVLDQDDDIKIARLQRTAFPKHVEVEGVMNMESGSYKNILSDCFPA